MKKFPVIPLIVAIVALVLSVIAGRKVTEARKEMIDNENRIAWKHVSMLGMDKFIADLKWVKLIQDMGKVKGKMTENAALYFANALDSITDLDPDLTKAYDMGSLLIANQLPDRAIALLAKARKIALEQSWSWPYYSGFYAERFLPRKGTVSDAECFKQAQAFYEEASKLSGRPCYVDHAWMRLSTRDAGDCPVKQLAAQKDFVLELKPTYMEGMEGVEGAEGMPPEGAMMEDMEGGMEMEDSAYSRLKARLLERSQALAIELLDRMAEESDPQKKDKLESDLDIVRAVFEEFRPKGRVCQNCLFAYGAGQFFCPKCGERVEAYGYCRECWKQGKMVLLHGDFCHICGAESP